MKRFADLNLRAPIEDMTKTERMIRNASRLGYSLVSIPLPQNASKEQVSQLKHLCNEVKLDFAVRVTFAPKNSNELLQSLRRYRRKFEVIAVRCDTKDVARQAAKDRRVDLLQFSVTSLRKRFFDEAEAELASQALASLEIELAPMLQLTSYSRVRLLSSLRKETATATRLKVPITVTSGAIDELLMRGPHDYAALTTLFDMHSSSALEALSDNPWLTVERNRKKLSADYVAPGIQVVGRRTGA
ncbi:MAG: RNase P subunit p30 family protein [Candidatus Bathyarchaeia archaeon]|nr:RNase P subunit p30 family protein [Candidatus Bathyarchaeia archaeon]